LNNDVFATFLAAVTDTQAVEFELRGSADVVARTTIGDILISNMPFNVTSALSGKPHQSLISWSMFTTTCAGINSFGHAASLSNFTITGSGGSGGNQYINAGLTTVLHNPSNISLQTNGLSLAIFYKDVKIGRAAIDVSSLSKSQGISNSDL